MYIDISQSGKYKRVLLRESYREEGKVKKRTVANISHCPDKVITALQFALRNVDKISEIIQGFADPQNPMHHGKSVGAVFTIIEVARRMGLVSALGNTQQAKLALWQIVARLIDQGSRLSAVRLHTTHALAEAIDLKTGFCEDHLYQNLAWLADHQDKIEDSLFKKLFKKKRSSKKIKLLLYDVTSSYFEGTHNALAAYGYNRDGKKGKLQIVIGLLCDHEGYPISVQVFSGNTSDMTTFEDQIRKAVKRFDCQEVTFIGDRGMIKSAQKARLLQAGFHYITALTRKQIETLEKKQMIQLDLFDEDICEVEKDSQRYILRRNPCRASDIAAVRSSKEASIQKRIEKKNRYLREHPRAQIKTAMREIRQQIEKLKCRWLTLKEQKDQRQLKLVKDESLLLELSGLDGCYVITTSLSPHDMCAEDVHAHYKNLSKVERAFRESKTGHLELRPIHVRKETSTRGHVLVVMLAYLLRKELEKAWREIDVTMEEGLDCLATISSVIVGDIGEMSIEKVPQPEGLSAQLLKQLNVSLPTTLVRRKLNVSTRVKTRKRI